MCQNRIWILGAADPEMEAIEELLRQCEETVLYATDENGRRVHPGNAYRCPIPEVPADSTVYAVECIDKLPVGWVRIDHHRSGDPGCGRSPKEFLLASSIGQVLDELARLGVAARIDKTGAHPVIPGADMGYPVWGAAPGVRYIRHAPDDGGGFAWYDWYYVAHLPPRPPRDAEEAARIARHPGNCACRYCVGGTYAFRIPAEILLVAASDHCLAAAYRGECPGVDPGELMHWRVETRAAFQERSASEILADIAQSCVVLREAPNIDIGGYAVRDLRDRVVPELPEASLREEVAYLTLVTDRDGRRKIVLGGCTSSEMVRAFMIEWAPAQGLVDIYGDPPRGFAGGYLPPTEA